MLRILMLSSVLLANLSLLNACSYLPQSSLLSTRDKEYLSATSVPPLKIPPGIASSTFNNKYPVTYQSYPLSAEEVDIGPPGLNK